MAWNLSLPPANWFTLNSPNIEGLVREAADQSVIAIDTETTGLCVWKDIPLYWSLCWGEKRMCMPASTLPAFQKVFADPKKDWVFANAKFDCHMLANVGVHLRGRLIDTQVMHSLIYEEESHRLKDMAQQVLGWRWSDFFDTFKPLTIAGEDAEGRSIKERETLQQMLMRFEKEDLPTLVEYASNDAYGTMKIYETLKRELESSNTFSLYDFEFKTLADIFFKTEVPFTKVLFKCERNGVLINKSYLHSICDPMQKDLHRIEREIVKQTGRALNPNSPPQLREYFIGERKMKPLKMSKGGKTGIKNPSVDADFLEHYGDDPVARLMLEYREVTRLLSTYAKGLQNAADPFDRVHTRFNQDVTRTGRLSSSDPNLQNIPRPENDKFHMRGAFVASPGMELIVADYEQLEMRLLAAASLEEGMVDIFRRDWDIHMGNAAMVFGPKHGITYEEIDNAKSVEKKVKKGDLPEEALTERMQLALFCRQATKSIGFGLNYGMREGKLARQIGCSKEEALEMIDAYMARYPAVKGFYAEAIRETEQTGFAHTILGRRRYLPAILSSREYDRWEAQRRAVNCQIQGSAADVCRMAMLLCDEANLEERYGCKMLMQVHDELMFECPKENVQECKEIISDAMQHPFFTDLVVDLTISMGTGATWLDAK